MRVLLCSPTSPQAPPTRASIPQLTVFTPTGPNHWPNCSASVHAANTRSGVASKVRVMRRIRLPKESATALPPGRLGRFGRLGSRPLEEGVEPVELLLPELAIELDPVGR